MKRLVIALVFACSGCIAFVDPNPKCGPNLACKVGQCVDGVCVTPTTGATAGASTSPSSSGASTGTESTGSSSGSSSATSSSSSNATSSSSGTSSSTSTTGTSGSSASSTSSTTSSTGSSGTSGSSTTSSTGSTGTSTTGTTGSWSFQGARYLDDVESSTSPLIGLPAATQPNDLIVLACATGGQVSLPPVTLLVTDGGITTPIVHNGTNSYTTDFSAYAYARTDLAFGTDVFSLSASQKTNCAIHVYRGGRVLNNAIAESNGDYSSNGLVSCGPLTAQAGGLAFFYVEILGETSGSLTLVDNDAGFVIRTTGYDGNPSGDVTPTQDGAVGFSISELNLDYGCEMLAFPP
ncbi:MAG: hypothetical protein JST54_28575 [Deltaproteobacteria bacterium]|nr:hypothetical protein [Deltaproteobacteria bacterium]